MQGPIKSFGWVVAAAAVVVAVDGDAVVACIVGVDARFAGVAAVGLVG